MPVYQELKYKDGDPDPALNELLAVRIWVYWPCQLRCRCYIRGKHRVSGPPAQEERGVWRTSSASAAPAVLKDKVAGSR